MAQLDFRGEILGDCESSRDAISLLSDCEFNRVCPFSVETSKNSNVRRLSVFEL